MGRGTRWIFREVASGLAAPVTNVVADGIEYGVTGHAQARSTWRGARGLQHAYRDQRAHPDDSATALGGEWSHGSGDRAGALASIGAGFLALHGDLTRAALEDRVPCAEWMFAEVDPTLASWQVFLGRMSDSPLAAYVTSWRVFEKWWAILVALRRAARSKGIALASPEPAPLPKTIWQRGADGTGSTFDSWMSLGRKLFFGAIAVTGGIGLYVTVRNVRRDLRELTAREQEIEEIATTS